ncbi:MAG: hypothetical protein ACR2O3_09305 [Rhizobiaceae bacterium]
MEKKKTPCHGRVRETRRGDQITYELFCEGDCDEGECDKIRTKPDHHGTWIEYCGCPGGERTCNIYIETDGRGNKRIDCFTLGCGDGQECKLVQTGTIEDPEQTLVDWKCVCKPVSD